MTEQEYEIHEIKERIVALEGLTAIIEAMKAENKLVHARIAKIEQGEKKAIILGVPQTPNICPVCGESGPHVCRK